MRALLAFSLVLLFGLPVYAADTPSPTAASKDAKPAYQGKKDQCLTEKVSIEKGKLVTTNNYGTKAYTDCVESNKTTRCTAAPKTAAEAAKCSCGTVTYTALGDKTCGPISKCDLKYDAKVKACSEGAMGTALADAAIRDIASDAVKNIPRDAEGNLTDAGREQLSKTLQNLGVDEARAKEIVNSEKDSKSAYDMVQALAEGDTAKAQELATTLELNEEVKTNFARLEAKDLPDVLDGVMTKEQQDSARVFAAQRTGFEAPEDADLTLAALRQDPDRDPPRGGRHAQMFRDAEEKYGVPKGHLASVAKIESNGNPNLCYRNDPSKACGLFQWIPSSWNTWSQRWNADVNGVNQPLSQNARFDPELATAVTAYYHGKNLERYGGLIANSGMDTSAALYAIHMFGDGGGPKFIRAYTDDPNTPAISVVGSAAVSANWPLLANRTSMGLQSVSLAEYEARVLGKMSGSTTFTASAGVIPGYSPFANLNPFSGPSNEAQYSYKAAYTTPTGYSQSSYGGSYGGGVNSGGGAVYPQQQQQQQPISQTILQQGNIQSGGNVTQALQAVASIIAQPREVVRGNPVIVSWSSVGTSPSAPCEVFLRSGTGTSSIARGNEGSQKVPTGGASVPVIWGFTLQCTALSGMQLIQQATSVSIK